MSVKEQKNKQGKSRGEGIEDIRYSGAIPQEILDEMTPEMVVQYYLWDEVAKRELELYPWLILPLVREVFHKTYPAGTEIRLLATEYVVRRIHKKEGTTLNSIYADIAVQIGNRDIYHLECQMEKDKEMVLRMLEYDIHIALVYGADGVRGKADGDAGPGLLMPGSVILYPGRAGNVPPEETCLIRFADGTTHEYRIPVIKVQDYTPEMIESRHLNMLIPFLPIRFREHISGKKDGMKVPAAQTVRKDLTEFIRECIMIIDREKRNGALTDMAGKDIMEFLSITCGYLLKNEPELKREVHEIMEPTILLTREKAAIAEEKLESSIKKVIERGQRSGQSGQDTKESIQDIFSMEEAEAEEKMKKYWKS